MDTHPFDPDQRRAVDISSNAVIAAGAGSGKTTVLAGRYLRLVRKGARVPEILTLTFTRKAAAEMYTRIHRLLAAHTNEELVRQQLTLFDQARISTLDSFCSRLARNDAARFGLPLSFAVDQEGLTGAAESLALDFILRHHRSEALQTMIAANGFEAVWKEFFSRYAVNELRITDTPDHRGDFQRQEQACRTQASEAFARLDALYEQAGRAAGGKGKTAKAAAEAAREWPDTGELLKDEEWDELTRLASARPYRKPGSNTTDPDLLILREIHASLSEAGEEAVSSLAILSMRTTYAGLMDLMDLFAVEWRELKQRRGLVSFADIVAMAVVLLKENTELRAYYKKQFTHIMIDEFQDNNEIQKELLYLLAEKEDRTSAGIPAPEDLDPARLFFVGDEKQSIYRFRGADVSVFKRLARELGGEPIELGTNYRSDPRLIDEFNRFFPRIFENSEELDFEAEFRPLKGRNADISAPEPVFRLHLLAEAEDDGETDYLTAVESEAFEAARLISAAIAGESLGLLAGDGGTRRPVYSDFALLLRSTGNQIIYERIFRRFGIPYTTENIRTLFLEAPANDIYAALQTVIYPEDRLAYAVFLRSFFVNLEDESLIRELLEESPPFSSDTSKWPAGEAEKYRIGAEIFHNLQARIDQVPHREIIRQLWFEHGYRYNLLKQPAYHGYLEFYDYLTALADRSWDAGESMALFLDFLRENLGDYKKLEEIEVIKDRQEGVRIMTIHKSKGLEFPIVLLGSAGQGSGFSGKRSPYYIDTEYGFTVNLSRRTAAGKQKFNPFYERGRGETEQRESAELKRLLYVACTRAEEHMIILGHQPQRSSASTPSLLDLTLTGFGCSLEEPDPAKVSLYSRVARSELNRLAVHSRSAPPFSVYREAVNREHFSMPPPDTPLSVSRLNSALAEAAHGDTDEGELLPALPVDELIHNREEQFGTIVHRCLELLITGRDPRQELGPVEGWSAVEAAEIAAAASEMASRFWNSNARRKLIPDESNPAVEVPFSLALQTGRETGDPRLIVDGVIDLYLDRGEDILCVDFKTNRRRREGEYAGQMWLYRRALEKLTGRPVSTCLIYLREGIPRYETAEFDPATVATLCRTESGQEF